MGTSTNAAQTFSCIDGDKQISGGTLGPATNANTLMQETCGAVDDNTWQDGKALNATQVKDAIQHLRAGVALKQQTPKIGGSVTAGATSQNADSSASREASTQGTVGYF
ncbi:hypothetical protein ERJ75_001540300 [Trypanosoma vivax]|nr:hypothetical protein ERJ75_001540300 [Trypanosoma vivax]